MKESRLHYSWVVCFACTFMITCTIGLTSNTGFGVYMPFIAQHNGFTGVQMSTIVAVRSFFTMIAMLTVTVFFDKLNMRLGVFLACMIGAVSFFIYAAAESIGMYCVAAALAGLSGGYGSMIPVGVIMRRWFVEKQGLALGICASGSGVAPLIFPPIITLMTEKYGLRASFFCEAFVFIAVSLIVFILVRNDPRDKKLTPYGGERAEEKFAAAAAEKPHTLSPRDRLWLYAGSLFIGAAGLVTSSTLSLHFDACGIDAVTGASAISVLGIVLVFSKLVFGWATDLFGTYKANFIFSAFAAAAFVAFCLIDSTRIFVMYLSVALYSTGMPLSTIGITCWARDLSNEKDYLSNLKFAQLAHMFGGFAFSMLPGFFYDSIGSYVPTFMVFGVFILLTMLCIQPLYHRYKLK